MSIIAIENQDFDNVIGTENQTPNLEQAIGSELDTERVSQEARKMNTMKPYEADEEQRMNEEKEKINGLRRAEVDKKLRSILFLALRYKIK